MSDDFSYLDEMEMDDVFNDEDEQENLRQYEQNTDDEYLTGIVPEGQEPGEKRQQYWNPDDMTKAENNELLEDDIEEDEKEVFFNREI
jgi:hypothetical protein